MKLAILMTCYNRKFVTENCLESLFKCLLPNDLKFEIFLVDDMSPDKTGEHIKNKFNDVNVIYGNGNLFWNRGMNLSWEHACLNDDFDFFLWLNDDTNLTQDAILVLFSDYKEQFKNFGESIIVGSCLSITSNQFSYGGRLLNTPVIPNGFPQKCNYINGNIVLIPKTIVDRIGKLDSFYKHSIGDTDYGLRAIKAGFNIFIANKYIGFCEPNNKKKWNDVNFSFINRINELFSIKNGNIVEYLRFVYVHRGYVGFVLSFTNTIYNILFPKKSSESNS